MSDSPRAVVLYCAELVETGIDPSSCESIGRKLRTYAATLPDTTVDEELRAAAEAMLDAVAYAYHWDEYRDRLRAALARTPQAVVPLGRVRGQCIEHGKSGSCGCRACLQIWPAGRPENHAEGCIAAPRDVS